MKRHTSCVQILRLTLLLLPLCTANPATVSTEHSSATDEKSALTIGELNEKNIQFMGEWKTLGGGDSVVDVASSSGTRDKHSQVKPSAETPDTYLIPPWVEAFTYSGNEDMEYVDRKFRLHPDSSDASYSSRYIARQIVHAIEVGTGSDPSVTLLTGEPRSGKSLGLAKIQHEIAKIDGSPIFNIRVNMRTIPDGIKEKITLKSIINQYVNDFSDRFYETLIANPENIVILFDDYEHLSTTQTFETLPIIRELAVKGVHVAMTGGQYTSATLRRHHLNPTIYEIPEMNIFEVERYLTNIWNSFIKKGSQFTRILTESSQRLSDYVTAFTQTLYRTPLLRTSETLNIFTEIMTINRGIFESDADIIFLYDYIFQQSKRHAPSDLLRSFENVPLDKMQFYDEFFRRCSSKNGKWTQMVKDYGAIAFLQILQVPKELLPKRLVFARDFVKFRNRNNYDFMKTTGMPDMVQMTFNHPEYQLYFGAKYLRHVLHTSKLRNEVFSMIFADSKYSRLLEFIDSTIPDSDKATLMSIAVPDGNVRFDILDNLLQHGLNNIYRSIHESIIADAEVTTFNEYEKYLQGTIDLQRQHIYRSEYIMGMMPSQVGTLDVNYYRRTYPIPIVHTRLEAIVENNLEIALLWDNHMNPETQRIDFGHQNYPRLLRQAIIRTQSSYNFVHKLLKHVIPKGEIQINDLNNLVYDTIDIIGDGCEKVVDLLVQQGAQPNNISRNEQTLLHAAVQWNSKNLLNYVISDLRVTADISDISRDYLLIDVLDANPIPILTQPGWWDMLLFLVKHVELRIPREELMISDTLMITQHDINTPFYKLIISNVNEGVDGVSEYDAREVMVKPMTTTDPLYRRFVALTRIIPPKMWDVQQQTLSLRREFLFTDILKQTRKISLLEIFLHYRGTDTLTVSDQLHYRQVIDHFIERQMQPFDKITSNKIVNRLVQNIGEVSDVHALRFFMTDGLYKQLHPSVRSKLLSLLNDYLKPSSDEGISVNAMDLTLEQFFRQSKRSLTTDEEQLQLIKFEFEDFMRIIHQKLL